MLNLRHFAPAMLAAVSLVIPMKCGAGSGGPARSATHAGDGITQFGDGTKRNFANQGSSGKLRWGKTYNAHKQNAQDVENCRWSLYRMDSLGRTIFIKRGNYANAKIIIGEQITQRVYLKSLDCGLWE